MVFQQLLDTDQYCNVHPLVTSVMSIHWLLLLYLCTGHCIANSMVTNLISIHWSQSNIYPLVTTLLYQLTGHHSIISIHWSPLNWYSFLSTGEHSYSILTTVLIIFGILTCLQSQYNGISHNSFSHIHNINVFCCFTWFVN